MSAQGLANLVKWYKLSRPEDRAEGALAYPRYHRIMKELAEKYIIPSDIVTAVFVSLSPNSDYLSNLRSTVTVLDALSREVPMSDVNVATYRHCLERAWAYGTGEKHFENETKGPKVLSFYRNILDPMDHRWVTVDGHIHALWQDRNLTMKEATIGSPKKYDEIRDTIIGMAALLGCVPCSLQAALWFTRKRVLGIKHAGDQQDLFEIPDDVNRTHVEISQLRPYPPRTSPQQDRENDQHAFQV